MQCLQYNVHWTNYGKVDVRDVQKNTRWRRAIRPLNLWNRHGKNQDEGEKKLIYLEKSPPPWIDIP